MRTLLVCLVALTSLAMGGQRPNIPDSSTPPPEPYQQRFIDLGNLYGANFISRTITFSFRSFWGSTIGMCQYNSSGRNHVSLSTSHWKRGSDTFREMLMFHELGHCMLGRGHKNSRHSSGRPESLMNSWLFNEQTYQAHRDEYLKELFTAAASRMFRTLAGRQEEDFGDCGFAPHDGH